MLNVIKSLITLSIYQVCTHDSSLGTNREMMVTGDDDDVDDGVFFAY